LIHHISVETPTLHETPCLVRQT